MPAVRARVTDAWQKYAYGQGWPLQDAFIKKDREVRNRVVAQLTLGSARPPLAATWPMWP